MLLDVGTANAGADIYDLSAVSVALQSTVTDPGVPLGLPFSVGSYGASALLNSNGESSADAGAPYSPLVSSLPSTGNGVAQSSFGASLPVVPTFPGYVSAKDPLLPVNKQNAGGYELVATAEPTAASGKVSIGGQSATSDQNNAFAVANSLTNDDGVFTEGAAGVHALTFDGVLDLANVSSYASLTRGLDGRTVPVTQTYLGTVSFAGLQSGLSGDGFTALGSAPVPLSTYGLAAVNDALRPSGITFTYLPEIYTYTDGSTSTGPTISPKKDVAGVVSGALQIFFSTTSDRGTSTETITIGRVTLNATSATIGAGTSAAGTGSESRATAGTDTSGGAVDDIAADPNALAGAALSGTVPAANGMGAQLPTANFVPATAAVPIDGGPSFESFYLVLAVAAALAAVGGQFVRLLAVQLR
jgi:hypothetical protein